MNGKWLIVAAQRVSCRGFGFLRQWFETDGDRRHVRHRVDALEMRIGVYQSIDAASVNHDVFFSRRAAPALAQRHHSRPHRIIAFEDCLGSAMG